MKLASAEALNLCIRPTSSNALQMARTALGRYHYIELDSIMQTPNGPATSTEYDALAQRLRSVEDHLEILNLLAGSAISADVAAQNHWETIYAPGASMDVTDDQSPLDRNALIAVVGSSKQQEASAQGMAHLSALPHIVIDGDTAVATGYLLVVIRDNEAAPVTLPGKGVVGGLSIYHLTVNRWDLMRNGCGWQLIRRTIRPLASEKAREMLLSGLSSNISAQG